MKTRNVFSNRILDVPVSVWCIVILAICLKLLFINVYENGKFLDDTLRATDARQYVRLAQGLLDGKGLMLFDRPTSYRTPGYPVFLAFCFLLFGKKILWVRFTQMFLSALMCVFVYKLGVRCADEKTGVLAALLTALYFSFTFWSMYIVSETLYVFMAVISVLALIHSFESAAPARVFFTGLLWGATILCRPDFAGFVFFACLWMFFSGMKSRSSAAAVKLVSVFALGVMLFVLPWTVRNIYVHREFVPLSTVFGDNLYTGNARGTTGGTGGWILHNVDYVMPDGVELKDVSEVQRQRVLVHLALENMKADPAGIVKRWPAKLANFYRTFTGGASLKHKIIRTSQDAFLYLFAAVGVYVSFRKNRNARFCFLFIVYYTILILLLSSRLRYRVYIMPFMIILASMGVFHVLTLFAAAKKRAVVSEDVPLQSGQEVLI